MEQKEIEILIRLRERRGLTQQEVAEELGVSRQAVSLWESGKAFPSMEKQIVLSRLYGVTLEELYQDGAARDKEVTREETPPAARDAPEVTEPKTKWPRKRRWVILAAIMACIWGGTFLWGRLTNSRAASADYLFWETVFLAVGLVIQHVWRNRKK